MEKENTNPLFVKLKTHMQVFAPIAYKSPDLKGFIDQVMMRHPQLLVDYNDLLSPIYRGLLEVKKTVQKLTDEFSEEEFEQIFQCALKHKSMTDFLIAVLTDMNWVITRCSPSTAGTIWSMAHGVGFAGDLNEETMIPLDTENLSPELREKVEKHGKVKISFIFDETFKPNSGKNRVFKTEFSGKTFVVSGTDLGVAEVAELLAQQILRATDEKELTLKITCHEVENNDR